MVSQPSFLGFGTWQCSNEEAEHSVYTAIKAGYRHIDCAFEYLNEVGIGKGIQRAISEGLVTRDQLWVTTKLWNTFHRPDLVEYQCRLSLGNLQLEYLDAFIIHWPLSFIHRNDDDLYPRDKDNKIIYDQGYTLSETWSALEKLVEIGIVRHIGVSNFTVLALQDLLSKAAIKPYVHQIEVHPYLQNEVMIKFCQERGITILAYSPLGGNYTYGPLSGKKTPCLSEPIIISIANKYKVAPSKVVLRWHFQKYYANNKDGLYCILPKSTKTERIYENTQIFDFALTDGEIQEINTLNKNLRLNDAGRVWWGIPTFD